MTVANNKSSSAHMQRGRPTCNPRGHVSARSHTLFTTEPHMPALFTRGSFLKGAEPRGPASRVLLWKQGRARSQWERGDYDMCFCACVAQSNGGVPPRVGGQILISSLQGGKHTVQ